MQHDYITLIDWSFMSLSALEINTKLATAVLEKTIRLVPFSSNYDDEIINTKHKILINTIRNKQSKDIKAQLRFLKLNPIYGHLTGLSSALKDYLDSLIATVSNRPNKADRNTRSNGKTITPLEKIENYARNATQLYMGNCGEKSMVALI